MSGASRSLLLLGVLCLVSCAAATIALAAPGHRSADALHACRHVKHRRCRRHPTGKQLHRKHKRGAPKPSLPKNTGAATPLTAPPAAVIPGAGSTGSDSSGSGTSPGATGSTPPATEAPAAPAGPAHVQVTAEDTGAFRFILSRASVPAGPVAIEFVNHGQDEHNLNVKPGEESLVGSLPNTAPGAHPSLPTLDLHAGTYTLFCSLPGHEAKGMKATLTVE
jgi:plastocyanin